MTGAGLDIRVEEVSKSFGETRALSAVSLSVAAGSVHGLVGENGAGKSTLGRIISGVIRPDVGAVLVNGEPVDFRSPRDALDLGIATIAQEIALVPALSAAENVLLGVEPSRLGFVRRRSMTASYRALAESVGFDIPAGRPVGQLAIAQQQQVEILRALSRDARLIVMDEPSARLSGAEVGKLHALIRRLAADGRSVLLISHFLNEVLEVADQVTVLRDGRVVSSRSCADESPSTLIESMLGRELGAQFPPIAVPATDAPVVLRVTELSGPGFADVSLDVRAGEVVGLAGLVGAGRTELGRALVGASRPSAGRIELGGQTRRFGSPRDARRAGVFMLPESRRDEGLIYLRSIRDNVTLASLDQLTRAGFTDSRRERRESEALLTRVDVGASGDSPVRSLSGGNQQKLLFARAMMARPRLLIADEPTRGVDVGAKRAIYDLLAAFAAEGMAILLISSEMEEIIGMSQRVLVMRSGRVVAELGADQISEAAILRSIFELAPRPAAVA